MVRTRTAEAAMEAAVEKTVLAVAMLVPPPPPGEEWKGNGYWGRERKKRRL